MTPPAATPARWLGGIALGAALLILWIIRHRYAGLMHDSQLYALLAAARLAPDLLGSDIMLRFGSQDSFTLFSPIYAGLMSALGTEPAAALVTLLSQLAFIAGAALLARRLMPTPYVWLGLALICALPGFYGARSIFAMVESFATPRLLAQALVLAGLAALLANRIWIAVVLALVATAIHPLMAAAGLVVGLYLFPAAPRTKKAMVIGAAVIAAAGFALLAARGEQFLLDDDWLQLLQTGTDYLFPSLWPVSSWTREALLVATLLVGALALDKSPARSFCLAAGLAAVAGTLVSYVGGDLLRIVLIVQLQLWRWNWIATFAAILLLPFITVTAWSRGGLWRAVVLLLGAAWLVVAHAMATLAITVIMVLLAVLAQRRAASASAGSDRSLFLFALVVAGLAVLFHLVLTVIAAGGGVEDSNAPAWINTVRAFARLGVLPWVAFVGIFLLAVRMDGLAGKAVACVGSVILLAVLLPNTAREWTVRTYGPERFNTFQAWRERIPAGAQVLWFDSPLSSWLLLRRPSYLSNQQEVSALFSRQAATVMKARVDAIAPHLEPTTFVGWSNRPRPAPGAEANVAMNLAGVCRDSDVKYVVSRIELPGATALAAPSGGAWLYGCP